jgi:hypothetical protein
MKKSNDGKNGTLGYARLHRRGLTLSQQSAVDLLAAGKSDTETAEALRVHRVTVTRWRCYDPAFQAALNARRAEAWASGVDRLRDLIPKALDALADVLTTGEHANRVKAAAAILRLAQLPCAGGGIGPTDVEGIIAELVKARIAAKRAECYKGLSDLDRMLQDARSSTREEVEAAEREARVEVLAELEEALAGSDEGAEGHGLEQGA